MDKQIRLSADQFRQANHLFDSVPDRDAIRTVWISPHPGYVRVTFDAGWGEGSYDIDPVGNSERVTFGHSAISAEAEAEALERRMIDEANRL